MSFSLPSREKKSRFPATDRKSVFSAVLILLRFLKKDTGLFFRKYFNRTLVYSSGGF